MSMMRGDFSLMRRMSTDPEIVQHRLTRGVVRRILAFARPYRGLIVGFITLVVISSALAVTPPLLFKQIIDEGVLAGNRQLVVVLGITVAALAVLQAVIGMVQRWCSSTIGEGLIFDLRTKVFDHVVQMPLAFFTRTQTGKLVSRLNSDVIGAQQAFTSTLSTVLSNLISLVLVLVGHAVAELAAHPGRAGDAAHLPDPGQDRRAQAGRPDPQADAAQRRHVVVDDRTVQCQRGPAGLACSAGWSTSTTSSPAGPARCATSRSRSP